MFWKWILCFFLGHLDHDVEGLARSCKGLWVDAPCKRCGTKRLEMAPKRSTLDQWPTGKKPIFKEIGS
jgi:hypothetical protein